MHHFRNVGKTQVRKKCECCYLTSLPNNRIHTFSKLEFSEHLGNEADRHALSTIPGNPRIPDLSYPGIIEKDQNNNPVPGSWDAQSTPLLGSLEKKVIEGYLALGFFGHKGFGKINGG